MLISPDCYGAKFSFFYGGQWQGQSPAPGGLAVVLAPLRRGHGPSHRCGSAAGRGLDGAGEGGGLPAVKGQ